MNVTLYMKTEENAEIQRLADIAGVSKSKFMVMRALEKNSALSILFKPRK